MANRLLPPGYQVIDANGAPVSGALLYTYEAGTNTPKNTYSDAAATIPNSNPVGADSAGRFGALFSETGDYRIVMTTAAGVSIFTADPVEGSGAATTVPGSGLRNVLINGAFSVNQRGITSAADDAYCIDRWYALAQSGSVTVAQQSLQADSIPTNIRLTQPDVAAKRIGIAQIVESGACLFMRGSSAALSGQVRCSLATPINYAILSWTGALDVPTSDVVLDWTSASYTAGYFFLAANLTVQAVGSVTPTAGVWTPIPEITAMMSSAMNNAIVFFWTANAAPQSTTLDIANVQLEQGAAATAFEYQPSFSVLSQCQRYWRRMQTSLQFPATAASQSSSGGYTFSPPMRVAPTITLTTTVAVRVNVDAAYPLVGEVAADGFTTSIICVGAGDTADRGRIWTADSEL